LTRPAAVRALLDAQAGIELATLSAAWRAWRDRQALLADARARSDTLDRERERLAWQVAELAKLAPADGEWDALNAEHQRRAHAQALLDGARAALAALSDDEQGAGRLVARAMAALDEVRRFDNELGSVADVLLAAQAQLDDAARSLHSYLGHGEPDPLRLAELDARIGAWMAQAKRCRRTPAELPAQLANWQRELAALDASANLESLEASEGTARAAFLAEAGRVSALRRRAVPGLSESVTQAMQQLGMAGGRFEVVLLPLDEPQAHGLESVEFRVAGHAGSAPRPLAKVASGGELSRLALAIAVTTTAADPAAASTLIFDEIDAGVGGTVADSVGRLLKQLGGSKTHATQVLAVTHLAQVAACADRHFVVSKALRGAQTMSDVRPAEGEARVAEIARMLGGERLSGMAHAQALLAQRHVAASVDTIAHAPAAGIADPRPQSPEPRRA
jgi:DNA repair protein RecN (Recombination protein N)